MSVRVPRAKLLSKLQGLIGGALSDYHNDRAPDRAVLVITKLEQAFDIVVKLREKYQPERPPRNAQPPAQVEPERTDFGRHPAGRWRP